MGENAIILNTIFHLLNFKPMKYITYWQKKNRRKEKEKERMKPKERSELVSTILDSRCWPPVISVKNEDEL